MPTIVVPRDSLYREIGKVYETVEEFEELCFQFGIEYDGTEVDPATDAVMYRVELPANRVDLLSVEGLGRALRTFLTSALPPQVKLTSSTPTVKLVVEASAQKIRPFCFAAVLRGVTFTPENFKSFIDLQDKLHQNIARRRQLVSMGTHDLSTIKSPFVYRAEAPEEICFVPLTQTQRMDGRQLMEWLRSHQQLRAYTHIIEDSPVWPVVRDSEGIVCSLPPLINSEHSKVTLQTRDVLIEVTATDRTKACIVTNTLVALFSQYCETPFTVEPVAVVYEESHSLGGQSFLNPDLSEFTLTTDVDYIRSVVGVKDLAAEEAVRLLGVMGVRARAEGSKIIATAPVTRSDILSPCDLAEDVAIAYGFNNIASQILRRSEEQTYMALSREVRHLLSQCGFHECLNWGLCSHKEAFGLMRRTEEGTTQGTQQSFEPSAPVVCIANPKTREFEIVRPTLMTGLLKALAHNKAQQMPLRLFELGEVVKLDPSTETQTLSVRHAAALVANSSGSMLEETHGLLDELLASLGLVPVYAEGEKSSQQSAKGKLKYRLETNDADGLFFPGRCVSIVVDELKCIGVMGVIHPEVLRNFGIPFPVSAFEVTLQPFIERMMTVVSRR